MSIINKLFNKPETEDKLLQEILSRKENKEGQPIERKVSRRLLFPDLLLDWCCWNPKIRINEYLLHATLKGEKKRTKISGCIYYCPKCGDFDNRIDYDDGVDMIIGGDSRNYSLREF